MFLDNKYSKWYFNIIENAKSQNRKKLKKDHVNYIYYENHHIIPRALKGNEDVENLILLTSKEHFICHLLLTKMCITLRHQWKMICAYLYFRSHDKNIKSKNYENMKKIFILNHPVNGAKRTTETKEKMSKSWTDERKQKKSINMIENNPSKRPEVREKLGQHGNDNPSKRPEVREKMSKSRKKYFETLKNEGIKYSNGPMKQEQKDFLSNLYKGKSLLELHGEEKANEIKQKISNTSKNKIWVKNDITKESKFIQIDLLEDFIQIGFVRGRFIIRKKSELTFDQKIKKATRLNVPAQCKHCGLKSFKAQINRWHDENCKNK